MKRILSVCCLFAAAISVLGAGASDPKDKEKDKEKKDTDPADWTPLWIRGRQKAPEFADIQAWINSEPVTMEKLKGKVVVVHFMAFGNIHCARNYPWYKTVWKDYKDKGVVVIGIHTPQTEADKNVKSVKKHVEEAGLTFPIAIDNKATMWQRYNNGYWPAVLLIDKRGISRWSWVGELGYKGAKGEKLMREKIVELLED